MNNIVSAHTKSIDFLLENAGPVIRYRLRRDILQDLTPGEEESLLEQIYRLHPFVLLQSYVKPDGYIGSGMHSWDNWRGQVLHETPLQDGESAARLLSYYCIPKRHPVVAGFVAAMRDEEILRKEFSYIPPEIPRFEKRFVGLNNGNCLQALLYTMQAMLGYGDDFEDLADFQQICLKGFARVAQARSLEELTKYDTGAKRKYNYPYIEAEDYFPDAYTLAMLAYTKSWRGGREEAVTQGDETGSAPGKGKGAPAMQGDGTGSAPGKGKGAPAMQRDGTGSAPGKGKGAPAMPGEEPEPAPGETPVSMLARALNHINAVMRPDNEMHVRICGKYVAPCFAMIRPIRAFRSDLIDTVTYRRVLSEIAMLGVGQQADVIRESVANVEEALDGDGVLRMDFSTPHNKRYSPRRIEYPSPYGDVRLEADYGQKNAFLCDFTFWALEFLWLAET